MSSVLTTVLLVCCFQTAQGENPFRKAKVGDWVEYQSKDSMLVKNKLTIVAKDDKEASYEVVTTVLQNGKEKVLPIYIMKIDLTKPYDPNTWAMQGKNVATEKIGNGKEKIKVGDKEYDTSWTMMKTMTNVNGQTSVGTSTMWISPDVPLFGMVRVELESPTFFSQVELIGSGRK
jgi:hypothetical protein